MTSRPADAPPGTSDRYVITLGTSSVPMAVRLAPGLQFPGLSVFRSRSIEDGRERFRLHLGYFGSAAHAEAVLQEVRSCYPTALVASAPRADSGSLDDTMNTAFTLVRGAIARLVGSDEGIEPAPSAADRPPDEPPAASPTLTPGQVASAMAPQRYAVQLDWSLAPIPSASVPRLGIFRAYSLYAVSVRHQGSPEHGLRLGFFKSLDGARQVADYVRHEFPHASIVPVSYREYTRARALTRPAAGTAAPVRASGGIEVIEERDLPPADAPAATPAPQPSGEVRSVDSRTREELLELLGAHELEVARDRERPVTITAEERDLLLRRPQRSLHRW